MSKSDIEEGIKLYKSGRFQQAINVFSDHDEASTENPVLAYYTGLCHVKLEQYEEALIYLEQVVTSSGEILHVYQSRMLLGYIYSITGRYGLARFEFDKVLEMGFESAQVYSALGYVAYWKKRTTESIDFFEKAVELEPENVNALNSLGYTLAESGNESARAVEYCKKAVGKKPDYPAYLDSLGWALFKNGDIEEARRYLRLALDGAKGNRIIAGHLKTVMENLS